MINTLNRESSHADLMCYLLEFFKDANLSKEGRKRVEILMWASIVLSNARLSDNPAEFLENLDSHFDFEMLVRLVSRLEEPAESTVN